MNKLTALLTALLVLPTALLHATDYRDVPALIEALKVPSTQAQAARTLGEMKARGAVDPLIQVVWDCLQREGTKGDDFTQTNSAMIEATQALGEIGDTHGLLAVMGMLSQGDSYRRQVAIEAAGRIGADPSTTAEIREKAVIPLLTNFLSAKEEPNSSVRLQAVFSLESLKDPQVIPVLEKAFRNDPAFAVRSASAEVLTRMGAPGEHDVFKDIKERMKKDNWDR